MAMALTRASCCSLARQRNPLRSIFMQNPHHQRIRFRHPLQSFKSYPAGFQHRVRAIHEATVEPITSNKQNEPQPQNWNIKMLYDGDCPLCMREVNMLRERNESYGTIKFVDISSDEYSPEENQGLDYKTVMGRIHAILSDGTVVTDVEAFRKLYEQVGLGWVYAVTKYEPVSVILHDTDGWKGLLLSFQEHIATIADAVYSVWAKYRLQVTGRPPLEEILDTRKKKDEICSNSNASTSQQIH
ncbi:hypothetical protein NC653_034893 [Populus alba x Populus x berolinensis]|uniref:Thiol-disulfide oxidoreductase DCC n=1 Tax=Populus alba x Populus x berolinensis TaxID=444605 RepID=A0AAD6LPS2_9ROSI|nr:hypothetical protein NC653_034893 [Populus alba x Populus x berolinensis]